MGKVKVNGNIVQQLGTKIDTDVDIVEYEGKIIRQAEDKKVYILLNKPEGYITTVKDEHDRDTIFDLVKVRERVVPVGRLDMYTSGALLLSNDGDFVYKLTHPKHEISKTYVATVLGEVTKEEIKQLRDGVKIPVGVAWHATRPANVKILNYDTKKNKTEIEIIIHEGKNRQVRKMCEAIGKEVIKLNRTKIGNIDLDNLKLGEWRYLNKEEFDF